MGDEVTRGAIDAEIGGDAAHWPALTGVEFEGLKVLGGDAVSEALHGGIEHVFFPFHLPEFVDGVFIGDPVERVFGRIVVGSQGSNGGAVALAEFIRDAPASLVHEPAAKGASIVASFIVPYALGDVLEDVLDNVFSFGVVEPRAEGQNP